MAEIYLLSEKHLKLNLDFRVLFLFTWRVREEGWKQGKEGRRKGGRKGGSVGVVFYNLPF